MKDWVLNYSFGSDPNKSDVIEKFEILYAELKTKVPQKVAKGI